MAHGLRIGRHTAAVQRVDEGNGMRIAIVVAPGIGEVFGMVGNIKQLRVEVADRVANRHAFPDEYAVRVGRSIVKQQYRALHWYGLTPS